jgi:competence protein ComEC
MNRNYVIASGTIGAFAVGLIIWFLIPDSGEDGLSDWGLHIAILDVGQADAIVMVAPDGNVCLVDAGHGSGAADRISDFLRDEEDNGFGEITTVKLGFVTHYDLDHMGGFASLLDSGIAFSSIYDQGPSIKRNGATRYTEYLQAVGDLNDNMLDDDSATEDNFIRKKANVGLHWKLGDAKIRCVAVRGDTKGSTYDQELDPSVSDIDENPGSIALFVTLGDFEFYTAGDQSSSAWKDEPDTEIAVVNSGVLGQENDIDVIKLSHHGSDTSTGDAFIDSLDPEVAVISSKYRNNDRLPKMVSIKQVVENGGLVYVTGDGHDPQTGTFSNSNHSEDDDFSPPEGTVFNDAGDVHIFVSIDGLNYVVVAEDGDWNEFSAVDSENLR